MNRAEIDNTIADILREESLDGRCDRHDVITDFVMALLNRRGEEWMAEHGYADE